MKKSVFAYFRCWLDDFKSPFQAKLFHDPAEGRKNSLTDWAFWKMLSLLVFSNPAKERTAWGEQWGEWVTSRNQQQGSSSLCCTCTDSPGPARAVAQGAPDALPGWEQHFTLPCRGGKMSPALEEGQREEVLFWSSRVRGFILQHRGDEGVSQGHPVQEGLWDFFRGEMRIDRVAWNFQ